MLKHLVMAAYLILLVVQLGCLFTFIYFELPPEEVLYGFAGWGVFVIVPLIVLSNYLRTGKVQL